MINSSERAIDKEEVIDPSPPFASATPKLFHLQVLVPIPVDDLFTYRVEIIDDERSPVRGDLVWVPLGKRSLMGCIWEVRDLTEALNEPQSYQVKPITLLLHWLPRLPEALLRLIAQVASYYHVTLGEAFALATPNVTTYQSCSFTHPVELESARRREAKRDELNQKNERAQEHPSLFFDSQDTIHSSQIPGEISERFSAGHLDTITPQVIEALAQMYRVGPLTYQDTPIYISKLEWRSLLAAGVLSEMKLPGRPVRKTSRFQIKDGVTIRVALKLLKSQKMRYIIEFLGDHEAQGGQGEQGEEGARPTLGRSYHELIEARIYAHASGLRRALRELVDLNLIELKLTDLNLQSDSIESDLKLNEPPDNPGDPQGHTGSKFELTSEQRHAVDSILSVEGFKTYLLHGVTGSGKTEVYLEVIEDALARGGQALVLIPEIGLTPQTLTRFRDRLNVPIYAWHSQLSPRERLDTWSALGRGEPCVLVGARSALFSPFSALSIIIIDESHDSSYKQGDGVRYHARDMAIMRAHLTRCPIILGSATPSLESMYNAQTGKYQLLELTQRPLGAQLPVVRTVDLTKSRAVSPDAQSITYTLAQAISERLTRQEQVILFLNRRGFSQSVRCQACGFLFECPRCAVSLPWHRATQRLECHHCEFTAPVPSICPQCNGAHMFAPIGKGTERIEEQLHGLFPHARIKRLDRDSELKPHELHTLMSSAQVDILIGTQMVTKGHDFPLVTLVGVIDADVGLELPDFRVNERSYQLLSQVSGRAGRAERLGEVIVQTYRPQEERLLAAITHNYGRFYLYELYLRQAIGYPPFSYIATVRLQAELGVSIDEALSTLQSALKGSHEVVIRGPSLAPLNQLQGQQRWITLLICKRRDMLHQRLAQVRSHVGRRLGKVRCFIDVDPHDFT